jgi:4-hydroxy-3-polyprenylbenzoate decarboxylase
MDRWALPEGFSDPRIVLPGIIAIRGPRAMDHREETDPVILQFCSSYDANFSATFPLLVIVDDAEFTARTLSNFLWVVFTRSDPANDVHGIGAFVHRKHWGCRGSLVIDARLKPHMPPPLESDPAISKRVDALFARGGPLHSVKGA